MLKITFALISVLTLIVGSRIACASEIRTWTDATGNHKINAVFVGVEGENVILRGSSGNPIKIPRSKLSESDQKFVSSIGAKSPPVEELPPLKTVHDVEAIIAEERLASEVVNFFDGLLKSADTAPEIKNYAIGARQKWIELSNNDGIKYGGSWLTAEQVKKMQAEAAVLIEQAVTLISVGNHALAKEALLKASKADPEGIQADFTLGMLHALVGAHPDEARGRFQICVRRLTEIGQHRTALQNANLKAALNNIAITEVRSNKASSAIARWSETVSHGKVPPEVIQNIGRLSDLASAQRFIQVSRGTVKAVGLLYAKAATQNESREYDPSTGWLYIPYICEALVSSDANADENAPKAVSSRNSGAVGTQKLRVFASGSGFAITDELVVTNRHVVEGAHSFQLGSGGSSKRKGVSGELVAVSESKDLALIRFPGLAATPMKLRDELPRLAADVRVLGFPESEFLGDALKVTAGSVAGLPQQTGRRELRGMILLDAVANPGNSGGPVIDVNGCVVGALTLSVRLDQSYTAAVPVTDIKTFVASHVGENVPLSDHLADEAKAETKWEDVVESAAQSTFQILVLGSPQAPSWTDEKDSKDPERPKRPTGWNGLEDPWCMHCNGLSHIACSVRGCRLGVIVGRKLVVTEKPGAVYTHYEPTQTPCRNCNGSGRVSCPHCDNGLDPSIKGER